MGKCVGECMGRVWRVLEKWGEVCWGVERCEERDRRVCGERQGKMLGRGVEDAVECGRCGKVC